MTASATPYSAPQATSGHNPAPAGPAPAPALPAAIAINPRTATTIVEPEDGTGLRSSYNSQGNLILEEWLRDGVLHRDNGLPSVIKHGIIIIETYHEYHVNGEYREDGPGIVCVYTSGSIEETWFKNGNKWKEVGIHYNDIVETFYEEDTIATYKNNILINCIFPNSVSINYNPDGSIASEVFAGNHTIVYKSDGSRKEFWKDDSEYYNPDGPALIKYFPNGKKRKEHWYTNGLRVKTVEYDSETQEVVTVITYNNSGVLSNPDEPSIVRYRNGRVVKEEYFLYNRCSRDSAPAKITYNDKGDIISEKWYYRGDRHRENGPALTHYENGIKTLEIWYSKGNFHRESGPCYIERSEHTGNIFVLYWCIDGEFHREDGPAKMFNFSNYYMEEWCINDEHHREDGPAISKIVGNVVILEEYFINGVAPDDVSLIERDESGNILRREYANKVVTLNNEYCFDF